MVILKIYKIPDIGVKVFNDQAACPFKTYIVNRLNVKPLKPINIGISAQEKGILLHKGLEYIGELIINNIKVDRKRIIDLVK